MTLPAAPGLQAARYAAFPFALDPLLAAFCFFYSNKSLRRTALQAARCAAPEPETGGATSFKNGARQADYRFSTEGAGALKDRLKTIKRPEKRFNYLK